MSKRPPRRLVISPHCVCVRLVACAECDAEADNGTSLVRRRSVNQSAEGFAAMCGVKTSDGEMEELWQGNGIVFMSHVSVIECDPGVSLE